jgi:integrase/recombinase XerD
MDVVVTITEYKNQLKALGYADKSIELYCWGLDVFSKYLKEKGIDDLRKVSRQTVVDYQAGIMTGPQAMDTKEVKLRAVKRLFEYLTDKNLLLINPAEGLKAARSEKRKTGTVLTLQEIQKVLQQPNTGLRTGIRDRAIMEVLYATGIRAGELRALEVYDVDLKDEVLFIRKGKGRKQRVVPLGKNAAKHLKEYLEKVRPRWAKKNPKERRLILASSGLPITPGNVQANLYIHARKAGIKKGASPHTFRRSCATHLIQNGADIRYVQKLLGHSNLKTTQQYTKVMPVDVKNLHKEYHPNNERET